MDVEYLRTAVALVHHGTVNRTAAALGLAPSSVSDRIKRLEAHLGTTLFERTTAGSRPTSSGRAYLATVEGLLRELSDAAERLRTRQVVTIGAQASVATSLLPDVLEQLAHETTGLEPVIRTETDRHRLLDDVAAGALDAALLLDGGETLGGLGFTPPPGLEFLDLREVPLVPVAAPGHTLAGRPVSTEELRSGATLLGREARCSFWMATERWLGPGTELSAVGGLAQVREWTAQGKGVAVLPDFAVAHDLEERRLVALDAPAPPLRLRLVWRRSRAANTAVQRLLYAVSHV